MEALAWQFWAVLTEYFVDWRFCLLGFIVFIWADLSVVLTAGQDRPDLTAGLAGQLLQLIGQLCTRLDPHGLQHKVM